MKLSNVLAIAIIVCIVLPCNGFRKVKRDQHYLDQAAGRMISRPRPRSFQCPDSSQRYDEQERKCGIPGRREHCGENMIFYKTPSSQNLGECDCTVRRAGKPPLVYHQKTKSCYFTYEQSYCRPGQWLTFNRYGNVICQKNKCLSTMGRPTFGAESVEETDLVPFQGIGDCVKLNEAYEKCAMNEIVTFVPDRVTPTCAKKEPTVQIGIKVIAPISLELPCEPGSFRSLSGNCQASFVF